MFLYQQPYLNALQTMCPHVLRYLATAVVINKNSRRAAMKVSLGCSYHHLFFFYIYILLLILWLDVWGCGLGFKTRCISRGHAPVLGLG